MFILLLHLLPLSNEAKVEEKVQEKVLTDQKHIFFILEK